MGLAPGTGLSAVTLRHGSINSRSHGERGRFVLTFARFLRHSAHAFAVTSPKPLLRLDLLLARCAAAVAASELVARGAGGDPGRGARRLWEALAVEGKAGGGALELSSTRSMLAPEVQYKGNQGLNDSLSQMPEL